MVFCCRRRASIFNTRDDLSLLGKITKEEAISTLRQYGYTVIAPIPESKRISDQHIRDYFYKQMTVHCGSMFSNVPVDQLKKDLEAIKRLQKNAQKKGIDKYHVNSDLNFLLKLFFKDYINRDIRSPNSLSWMLGPSGSWILRKIAADHSQEYLDYLLTNILEDYYG